MEVKDFWLTEALALAHCAPQRQGWPMQFRSAGSSRCDSWRRCLRPLEVMALPKEARDLGSLQEVALRLLKVSLSELQDSKIVEAFCMIRVGANSNFETLICQLKITDTNSYVTYVVVNLAQI